MYSSFSQCKYKQVFQLSLATEKNNINNGCGAAEFSTLIFLVRYFFVTFACQLITTDFTLYFSIYIESKRQRKTS